MSYVHQDVTPVKKIANDINEQLGDKEMMVHSYSRLLHLYFKIFSKNTWKRLIMLSRGQTPNPFHTLSSF